MTPSSAGSADRAAGALPTLPGLAKAVHQRRPRDTDCRPFVVLTGGEPLLQADECLIEALHRRDFEVAIKTNGTILPPPGVDWICVSPKAGAPLRLRFGERLKLVYPQSAIDPTEFESLRFDHFLLQPMDGPIWPATRPPQPTTVGRIHAGHSACKPTR